MPMILNPYRFATAGGAAPSNLVAALGGFNAPASGTTGVTVSVTGLAFQPVFVLLWMVGRTETSDAAALGTTNAFTSFGMFNATEQYTWGTAHASGSGNSNVGEVHRADCCIMKAGFGAGGGQQIYRGLNLSSLNSDGFTLAINSNSTRTWAGERIHYLALAGSDLSNTKVNTVTVTSGTGTQSYTSTGFQAAAMIFAHLPVALNTFTGNATEMVGAATGPSNQWVWGGESDQNVTATDTARYFRTDECHASLDIAGANLSERARFVSLDATGFTLNRLEGGTNYGPYFGALAGINAKAGTFTAASGGGSVTGLGFAPTAILFLTHGTTESTADTPQQDHTYSIGAAVSGTQLCAHAHDIDNQANKTVAVGHRNDSVVMTTNSSAALDSRIAVASLDSDGFTYTMPTSTNNGYIVGYLALG